jgi:C_GCAxxG_C_C family probable redox protein/uncharacterized protein (TIGR02246 family)
VAVLQAVCQEREIELDVDLIRRIAFGFAGGMGNTGAVCGAVIGAVMAIGLERGRADSMEAALRELDLVAEFRRRFEAEMGTISCRELTGADLTSEEGRAKFMSSDAPQTACFPAVGVAYGLAVDLLKETSWPERASAPSMPCMTSPAAAAEETAAQAAIRALDGEMVAALDARDLGRYMSHLAEDATWMPPNLSAVTGRSAIRELVSELLEIPDFTVAHHPLAIEVSHGGDLAFMTYAFEFTVKDENGTAATEKGKDVSVFKKVDGSWKLIIDMWNTDGPPASDGP